MKAKLYSSPVVSVEKDATIDSVLLKMQLNHIKSLLVTSKNKPTGIVTETDIVKFLEEDNFNMALDEIQLLLWL